MNSLGYYNLETAMQPVWQGDTVHNESILFVPHSKTGETLPGRLLYMPTRVLTVRSANFTTIYREGVDYCLEDGALLRLPTGDMPFFTLDEYYPEQPVAIPIESAACPGRFVRYEPNGIEILRRQVAVTYRHCGTWPGKKPESQLHRLPRAAHRLRQGLPFHLLFYGDSFLEGCDASGHSGIAPFMPPLDRLVTVFLAQYYKHNDMRVTNTSVGGTTSAWGLENAQERVVSKAPNLVVIRFGMNDGSNSVPAEAFLKNIQGILAICRAADPTIEFLIISTDLPNPDCKGWTGTQRDYQPVLEGLASNVQGCGFLPAMWIHQTMEAAKGYAGMCANNVNHPNDFMVRVYARAIAECLL